MMTIDPHVKLTTEQLGGVAHPSAEALAAMHEGNHLLRARDGQLTEVPVEKSRLPFDPKVHPQGTGLLQATDKLIYAPQASQLCKTTDGGRSWTSLPFDSHGPIQVLADGTLICVRLDTGPGEMDPATVFRSSDEGQSWQEMTRIPIEVPGGYQTRYTHWTMTKLPDETLILGMDLRDETFGPDRFLTAATVLTGYRSTDGGQSWQGPIKICESAAEGGIVRLPSGRLLASIRYQRGLQPEDSQAVHQLAPDGFKHHFLIDSDDGGLTWKHLRPLTTLRGQCYGYPAVQSDGTVVIIHDTRYGPGPDAARAMISRDEGQTWEDEVYYVFFGRGGTGYSRSVTLDDDTILTVGGSSSHPDAKKRWDAPIGHTQFTAIRWKPVKG